MIAEPRGGTDFAERDAHFLQSIANIVSTFLQRERLHADARLVDANPAAERVLGASTAALRRRSSQRVGITNTAGTRTEDVRSARGSIGAAAAEPDSINHDSRTGVLG